MQDFCADLRGKTIYATGVEGSSIQDTRNAAKPVLHTNGILPAIPKTKAVQASAAGILQLAWQTTFRGLAPVSASREEIYQAGASLYASIDRKLPSHLSLKAYLLEPVERDACRILRPENWRHRQVRACSLVDRRYYLVGRYSS